MTRSSRLSIFLMAIVLMLANTVDMNAQEPISPADSLLFAQAFNDTSQLRQIILMRQGNRIAAMAHNRLGALAYKAKQEGLARLEYGQTFRDYAAFPERPDAAYWLGKIAYQSREFGQSLPYLHVFLQSNPAGVHGEWARYFLVKALAATGDSELVDAVRGYFSVQRDSLFSKDVIIQKELVRYLEGRGNYAQAHLEAQKLDGYASRGPDSLFWLGKIAYEGERFEQSKPYLRGFLQSTPSGYHAQWARYFLAKAMIATDDSGAVDAIHAYFASPHDSIRTKDASMQYELVRYLGSTYQYDQGITEARRLITDFPNSHFVGVVEPWIADYYLALGDSAAAVTHCKALLAKYPSNSNDAARAQHFLAGIYACRNNFGRARAEFVKVKNQHPSIAQWTVAAEYGLAMVEKMDGESSLDSVKILSALKQLRLFVANHPRNRHVPRALMNIADLCTDGRYYQKALDAYNGIIRFDTMLIDSGRHGRRSNDLKAHQALVLKAHMAKSILLRVHMQDPVASLAECDLLLADHPHLSDALLNKAVCLIALDRVPEARPILQSLIQEETAVKEAARQILNTLG